MTETATVGNVCNRKQTFLCTVPPSWRAEPADTETTVGRTVSLSCAAEGYPVPRIQWKKDSGSQPPVYEELDVVMSNYRLLRNGSLVIYNTQASNKGFYLCQATNGIGVGLSKLVFLTVHVPARFSMAHQNVTALKGDTAVLDCTAEGDKPVSITWFSNGHQFDRKLYSHIILKEEESENGTSSKLIVHDLQRKDTTTFECVASNEYGSDRLEVKLIVQEPPEPPINAHVNNFTSRSLKLSWKEPYDGNSAITSYIIQYKNMSVPWSLDVPQIEVDGLQQVASLSDLMPAHVYNIRVLAVNDVGASNYSNILTVTTKEEVPEAPPRDVRVKMKDSETLLVSWKPPDKHLQHGEIMGYYIGYRLANSSEPFHYKTFEVIPGIELQNTLTNLQKFTEYTILVQAYNRVGAGPRSKEVVATTDEDVPDAAPLDVQCTALTSQSILVMWSSPPATEINGILKGYKVVYRSLADWNEISPPTEQVTQDQKFTLRNLESFCNYSIEVRAYTAKGDGVSSQPIFCRTQEDVPGAPADIKALVMDSKTVLISWKPPLHPNGRIRKYKVYVRSFDGFSLDKDQFDIPAEQTYYTISHLELHHRYEFWVTASTLVGEGAASRRVVQVPASHVPARVASFGNHITVALQEDLQLHCIVVGQPSPKRIWTKNGKAVTEDSHVKINDEYSLFVSSVQTMDSGNYTCSAENMFGKDEITYSVKVQVLSSPVALHVSSTTVSSITLQWQSPSAHVNLIQGYYLYFKREFGEWEKVRILSNCSSYTLNNLQCGTKYHFYMQAFNQLGQSTPTLTVTTRTQGSAPVSPRNTDLIRVNSTSILLNLTSWNDGGCPITSVVVEYKLKKGFSWTLVSNNIKIEQTEFMVLDLEPETWYALRVTAHNSAGSTIANYNFVTLTHTGATIAPDLIVYSNYGSQRFFGDTTLIAFIVAGTTLLVVAILGLLIYLKKCQEIFSSHKCDEKTSETGKIEDLDRGAVPMKYDNIESGIASANLQEAVYIATPMRVSLGQRQDISPYATFRVPVLGDADHLDAIDNVESHRTSSCLQYSEKPHHSSTFGSCPESPYPKIHKKPHYENETCDWIPLHNLYQAHRY
ncbi:Down syndrome cell adhesion molecule-like protein Dscam2 [Schistocerca serialis cubense]|uniref:Down syndrome cell adhesion molecule-like protein Dscam2 n=1 Tax=Schistocerca serialis cubense TaxID=2023355 RepID=UPI00214E4393|nr:Down syndrome cell adhesion molecule-like protein Dscam2 [Schistocerca serialis cubense]